MPGAARLLPILAMSFLVAAAFPGQLLRPQDVNNLPAAAADHRIAYGDDPLQFGDLRLPKSSGPHPVAIVVHGGCWLSKFANVQIMAAFCDALTRRGLATWNIEYRCVDNAGGGWPGTFDDVASAVDHVKILAPKYRLDLKRVVVVGHSAGGHLALWAAARHRLSSSSPLFRPEPLRLSGVVDLAGPGDLESFLPMQERICGDTPITKLVGGVYDRYKDASPARLLPLGVRQILITGSEDGAVAVKFGRDYETAARKSGDDVRFIVVEKAGHFEVIAPRSGAWPVVEKALLELLGIR
jgi:acetyl esterase/lipase